MTATSHSDSHEIKCNTLLRQNMIMDISPTAVQILANRVTESPYRWQGSGRWWAAASDAARGPVSRPARCHKTSTIIPQRCSGARPTAPLLQDESDSGRLARQRRSAPDPASHASLGGMVHSPTAGSEGLFHPHSVTSDQASLSSPHVRFGGATPLRMSPFAPDPLPESFNILF